nr:type I methionyl aminopeptidase [Thalassoroseus pseudoceratinae]
MLNKKPPIYNERDRQSLRTAAKFNAQLMDHLRQYVEPGVTTNDLDRLANEYTLSHGHTPACLGYRGYPKTICTSVNDVVCHGIPNDIPLQDGDIVNVDITTIVDGWHGDQSETFLIGEVSSEAKALVQTTFDSLWKGIHAIKPGGRVVDIGRAIYHFARAKGYEIVREYQGHGIGRAFHQEPGVPHFPDAKLGRQIIKPGMCFTIEPMLNIGGYRTSLDRTDGWTVRTVDGGLSAQFEHTILMTQDGPEVLTVTESGPQEGHIF